MQEQTVKSERLFSLDLLRGLDIFFLTVLTSILSTAHEKLGFFSDGFYGQLAHQWGKFHFIDIVMPMFIFMCGAAVPFALGRRLKDARPTPEFWKHLAVRFVFLWICGMIAQGNLLTLELGKIQLFDNTLQTIACGYVIAALVLLIRRRWVRWLMPVLLALVYTIPLAVYGKYEPTDNFAYNLEQWVVAHVVRPLGMISDGTSYTWFATVPMFGVMTLLGMISTEILTDRNATGNAKALRLGLLGAGVLALGWATFPFIPSIKHIFTLTFTAQAMGWCMISLALLYYLTDVLRFRRGLGIFILFGQFALTAYMLTDTPLVSITNEAARSFSQGLYHFVGANWGAFLTIVVQGVLVVLALVVRRRLKKR